MESMEDLKEEVERLRLEVSRLKSERNKIPPHKHCLNCGIAIPPDKTFCSKKCENEWNAMIKRKKMNMYIWMAMIGILLIILVASAMGGG